MFSRSGFGIIKHSTRFSILRYDGRPNRSVLSNKRSTCFVAARTKRMLQVFLSNYLNLGTLTTRHRSRLNHQYRKLYGPMCNLPLHHWNRNQKYLPFHFDFGIWKYKYGEQEYTVNASVLSDATTTNNNARTLTNTLAISTVGRETLLIQRWIPCDVCQITSDFYVDSLNNV